MIVLFFIFLLSALITHCQGTTVYYVTPNDTTGCDSTVSEECHTLYYYTHNITHWPSNITLIFLPGEHTLTDQPLVMKELNNVKLLRGQLINGNGYSSTMRNESIIRCKGNNVPITSIGIYTTNTLTIEGLTVVDCPYVLVEYIATSFTISNSTFSSQLGVLTIVSVQYYISH